MHACVSVCARACVHACSRPCAHTASLLWTFCLQSVTVGIVIKVLSSRACALDIEMRTATPEGRAPGVKGSKVVAEQSCGQAGSGNFFCKRASVFPAGRPFSQRGGHRVMLFYGTKADMVHCLRSTLIILSSWRVCHQGSDMPLGFYLCCPRRGNGERGSAFH